MTGDTRRSGRPTEEDEMGMVSGLVKGALLRKVLSRLFGGRRHA